MRNSVALSRTKISVDEISVMTELFGRWRNCSLRLGDIASPQGAVEARQDGLLNQLSPLLPPVVCHGLLDRLIMPRHGDVSVPFQFAFRRFIVARRSSYAPTIGLYRDVWITAIASSRNSLATQAAAICARFQGRRVRHEYVTMHITFLTRKSALIYRRGLRQRVASLTLDCNGVFAIRAYGVRHVCLLVQGAC